MYQYKAELIKVIDGDTIDLQVDLGFHAFMKIRFRLNGVDTPEIRGESRDAGLIAKKFITDTLTTGELTVVSKKTGKYGRWLGVLFVNKTNINELMIEQGHAVPYFGGKRT